MKFQRWGMGTDKVSITDATKTGFVRIENDETGEAVEVTEGVLEEYFLDIIKREK